MGRKDNPGARAGAIKLEAWALTHDPQFLTDIGAAEEEIAAGTTAPLDETLTALADYGPEDLERDIQEFARAEAYEDDPLRSSMRTDVASEPASKAADDDSPVETGDRDRVWKLFLAHEKEMADAGDERISRGFTRRGQCDGHETTTLGDKCEIDLLGGGDSHKFGSDGADVGRQHGNFEDDRAG